MDKKNANPIRLEWVDSLISANTAEANNELLKAYILAPKYSRFYRQYLKRISYRLFPLVKNNIELKKYSSEEEYFRLLSFALWHDPAWALPRCLDYSWPQPQYVSRWYEKISKLEWTDPQLQEVASDYWVTKDSHYLQNMFDNVLDKHELISIRIKKTIDYISSGGQITPKHLTILEKDPQAVTEVMPYFKLEAKRYAERGNYYHPVFRYIDYNLDENSILRPDFSILYYLFDFYKNNLNVILPENIYKFDKYTAIALKVLKRLPLTAPEEEELIRQLYAADCTYSSSQTRIALRRISMCEFIGDDQACQTICRIHLSISSFADTALEALKRLKSDYYYRNQISELISVDNRSNKISILKNLVRTFPEKESTIYQLLLSCKDPDLDALVPTTFIPKEQPEITAAEHIYDHFIVNQSAHFPDMFLRQLRRMKPKRIVIATGFFHSSGINNFKDIITDLLPHCEIVFLIGALQNYKYGMVSKMDAQTAAYLNVLLQFPNFQLFTDEHEFYHGKFYCIDSAEEIFISVGSSNVSKTAYYLNQELDFCIHCSKQALIAKQFEEWLNLMLARSIRLSELDITRFRETYSDEQQYNGYESSIEKEITRGEFKKQISQLTDDQHRKRLEAWLKFEPEHISENVLIEALSKYYILDYSSQNIIVFESREANNAYYAFKGLSITQLREKIKDFPKKKIMKEDYCIHGYHYEQPIEDFISYIKKNVFE